MKRIIFCLILIIFLCGCMDNINESLFIASIGIEKGVDEYRGFFYLPLSSDVGKTSFSNKGSGEFLEVGGKNIQEIFNNAKAVNSLDVNMKHVSSVVLNKELYNEEFLDDFISFVKYSDLLDFNFYFFSTEEKMEDIYSFQNPNQESVLNSLLVISGDNEGVRLVGDPVHFVDFSKKFYDNRSILIPSLEMEELWNINNEKVKNFYPQSGIYYFRGEVEEVYRDKGSPYLKDNVQFYDEIENEPIYFSKYRLTQLKDKLIIKVKYDLFTNGINRINEKSVESLIMDRITTYIDKYKEFDPLDLSFYKKQHRMISKYEDLTISVIF